MTNPFDAATPAMIECYEANVAYYRSGKAKPNYPMPVTAGTAAMSVYHQDGWPNTIWPYMMVKDELKYLD